MSENEKKQLIKTLKAERDKYAPKSTGFFSGRQAVRIFGAIVGVVSTGVVSFGAASAAGFVAGVAAADLLFHGLQEAGLIDPSEHSQGGPIIHLNHAFYSWLSILVDNANNYSLGELEQYSRALLRESFSYLNNRPWAFTPVVNAETMSKVIMADGFAGSRYAKSMAILSYARDRRSVGSNEASQRLSHKWIVKMEQGTALNYFALGEYENLVTAIKNNPMSAAHKTISIMIRDEVRNLKNIQINVNEADAADHEYNFKLKKEKRDDGEPAWLILPERLRSDYGGPTQKSLTEKMITDNFLNNDIVNFPNDFMPGANTQDPPEFARFIKKLENFDEINENTDITKFKFERWTDIDHDYLDNTTGLGWVSSLIEWTRGQSDPSPENLIKQTFKEGYFEFILQILALDGGFKEALETTTVAKKFDNVFNIDLARRFYSMVAMEKEITRRVSFIRMLEKIEKDRPEDQEDTPFTEDEIEKAKEQSEEEWLKTDAGAIDYDVLDDEALKNMQKLFKQCALMFNISKLKEDYQSEILKNYSDLAYNGRFYIGECASGADGKSNQESFITKLVSSKEQQKLFELQPWQISSLTPKIRLFKSMETAEGKIKEVEFSFERTSKIDREGATGPDYSSPATKFLDAEIDKGSGVGMKEFSVSFEGTNPAEARNDIKATLKLFFQTFEDFIRYRTDPTSSEVYRYADLVIHPMPNKKTGKSFGEDVINNRQYHPSFYRIRADLGYNIPDYADEDLRESIEQTNKSFTLTMVDHDLSFNKDGSVNLTIDYRAYLESLLKHPLLDALASPKLQQMRVENNSLVAKMMAKRTCSKAQLRELQISLQSREEKVTKESLQSILERLESRGVIYSTKIKQRDRAFFLNNGYFSKCDLETVNEETTELDTDLGKVLMTSLPEESDDFDFLDSKDQLVQYFYFGDLLYTILDCAFDQNDLAKPGMKNNRIILGSFEFESFMDEGSSSSIYGIHEMPISIDFFSRWFLDNVTTQKDTRKTFPILLFIRQLSNSLIRKSIVENCVNRKMEKNLRFQTSQITAFSKDGKDPFRTVAEESFYNNFPTIDVDAYRSVGTFPLKGSPSEQSDNGSYYNYIILSALGSTLSYGGTGKYEEDIEDGRFHVQLGQSSGLVKSISLSKTNTTYLREARYMQNGTDGLLQLSNVYVATVEMFGNTIFYPGMEFFFNPYGLGGGTTFGRPQDKTSIANKMGIGGYHTILSVRTTLTPGKFSTSVKGRQYYAGDKTGKSNGQPPDVDGEQDIENYTPLWADGKQSENVAESCNKVISSIQFGDGLSNIEEDSPTPAISPSATTTPIEAGEEELIDASEETSIVAEVVADPGITPAAPAATEPTAGVPPTETEEIEEEEGVVVVTQETLEDVATYKFEGEFIIEGTISSSSTHMGFRGKTTKGFFLQSGDLILFWSYDKEYFAHKVESDSRIFSRKPAVLYK